jgi:hypothetical protein
MKFVLASAVLASLLLAGVRAHAEVEGEPGEAVSLPVGRCLEVPMSLALAVAEREATRWLPPQAAMSTVAAPVSAAPPPSDQVQQGRGSLPYTPLLQLCSSPDDPRCHVSTLPPTHSRVQLDAMDHGFAPAPSQPTPPPAVVRLLALVACPVAGGPCTAHHRPPWRPPAA